MLRELPEMVQGCNQHGLEIKDAQPVPEFFEVPESRFIHLAKVAEDTDPWASACVPAP
jgi:hypothetical protein